MYRSIPVWPYAALASQSKGERWTCTHRVENYDRAAIHVQVALVVEVGICQIIKMLDHRVSRFWSRWAIFVQINSLGIRPIQRETSFVSRMKGYSAFSSSGSIAFLRFAFSDHRRFSHETIKKSISACFGPLDMLFENSVIVAPIVAKFWRVGHWLLRPAALPVPR